MATKSSKQGQYNFLASIWLLVTLLIIGIQVDAQFFTKSSKSIPRMGRRSDESMNQYRHSLIDTLVDAYGPTLVEALEAKAAGIQNNRNQQNSQAELAFDNEQPLEFLRTDGFYDAPAEVGHGARDERASQLSAPFASSSSAHSPRSAQAGYRDASLAMRALNTNRFIQHLASGQPLMSYDGMFHAGNQQSSAPIIINSDSNKMTDSNHSGQKYFNNQDK